jgi:hypothetical protein
MTSFETMMNAMNQRDEEIERTLKTLNERLSAEQDRMRRMDAVLAGRERGTAELHELLMAAVEKHPDLKDDFRRIIEARPKNVTAEPKKADENGAIVPFIASDAVLHEIAARRAHQVKNGHTAEHDDKHTDHSLIYAAIYYAWTVVPYDLETPHWPWRDGRPNATFDWKSLPTDPLIDAAALLVAEIERRRRALAKI